MAIFSYATNGSTAITIEGQVLFSFTGKTLLDMPGEGYSSWEWTDVTNYVTNLNINFGRVKPNESFSINRLTIDLNNSDRRFDPEYTSGPYYTFLNPGVAVWVKAWCVGDQTRKAWEETLFFGFVNDWGQSYLMAGQIQRCKVLADDLAGHLAQISLPPTVLDLYLAYEADVSVYDHFDDPCRWIPFNDDTIEVRARNPLKINGSTVIDHMSVCGKYLGSNLNNEVVINAKGQRLVSWLPDSMELGVSGVSGVQLDDTWPDNFNYVSSHDSGSDYREPVFSCWVQLTNTVPSGTIYCKQLTGIGSTARKVVLTEGITYRWSGNECFIQIWSDNVYYEEEGISVGPQQPKVEYHYKEYRLANPFASHHLHVEFMGNKLYIDGSAVALETGNTLYNPNKRYKFKEIKTIERWIGWSPAVQSSTNRTLSIPPNGTMYGTIAGVSPEIYWVPFKNPYEKEKLWSLVRVLISYALAVRKDYAFFGEGPNPFPYIFGNSLEYISNINYDVNNEDNVLTAIQSLADLDNAICYTSKDGIVVLRSVVHIHRLNISSRAIGEGNTEVLEQLAGLVTETDEPIEVETLPEIKYTDFKVDSGWGSIVNHVEGIYMGPDGSERKVYASNDLSIRNHKRRTMSVRYNTSSREKVEALCKWIVDQRSTPRSNPNIIEIIPARDWDTDRWSTVAGLDIDQQFKVYRRPELGNNMTYYTRVEGYEHNIAPGNKWTTTIYLSAQDTIKYFTLDSDTDHGFGAYLLP